jgi:dipeptide/tripeptide permease
MPSPRTSSLVILLGFVTVSIAYAALAPVLGYHIEWAGVTMLAALGIALGLMWYVLNAGESGR